MIIKIKDYFKLIRVKHYIKNILVLLPIFFAGEIFNTSLYKNVILGFICFSLLSSIIYIINDIHDINDDKKHPIKKNRPLASGRVSICEAIFMIVFMLISLVIINVFFLNCNFSYLYLVLYFVLNILYSYKLKNTPIIDIAILSLGFLIRVLYGGTILYIPISNWLFLTILCGALFMSMGKRRNELLKNGNTSRKVLEFYSTDFLNKNMYMFLSMTLVFFSLWVLEQNVSYLVWGIPLVFVICLRYSLDIENSKSFGDPVDVILSDKVLILLVFLLAIVMSVLLYLPIGV